MVKDITRLAWIVFVVGFVSALIYFFPWSHITWGKLVMEPGRVLTVTGSAESQEKNQIARFSAGVNATHDNRDTAIKEVNTKITSITQAVKDFGIDSADIITQSMSVNQMQTTIYDNGVQKQVPGQWNVSNTIEVTLRDVNRASSLADILSKSGATNVWGPNFQLDTSKKAADQLTEDAIANARTKAEVMAKASGATLGKVISVTEGVQTSGLYPVMMRDGFGGGGGGAPVESGTTTISKSVTVVWSLE
jgi:uncharacterized protein YggE